MKKYEALPATDSVFALAEGPYWDANSHHLLWVDIQVGKVFSGTIQGDEITVDTTHQFDGTVGAVVRANDGSLLVAASKELIKVLPDGARIVGPRVVPQDVHSRCNDGKVDPQGRFLIGTLALDNRIGQEHLLRLELDGTLTTIDDDVVLSNGLGWDLTGENMYNIDSGKHVIWKRSYSAGTEQPGPRQEFVRIDDGYPDGLTIDAAGNLWVAVWGCGEIRCFNPNGIHISTIITYAPNTTSCSFVGEKLDRLLISSASVELSAELLARHPKSGSLFLADVEAVGLPPTLWAGSFK